MADADRLSIAYAEEVGGFAVSPTGTYKNIRITGETLKQATESTSSAEIRPDRQIPDVIRTNIKGDGDVNFEFSYGTFDDWLQAVVGSAGWSSPISIGTLTLTVAGAGPTYTVTRSAGNWTSDGFLVNQWVKFLGLSIAGNNNVFKITNVGTTVLTVSHGTMTAEGPTAACTAVMGGQVTNGTTLKSWSIERQFTDLSNLWALHAGLTIDNMSLAVSTDGIITGSFSFLGKNEVTKTVVTASGYTAAPTNDVMNAVDNVIGVFENGLAVDLTSVNMQIANNLRDRQRIGTLGPISIGSGKIECTGSMEGYFSAATQIDKYLAFTSTKFALSFKDSAGNRYVIDFPKIKFTTGPRNATAQNSDIMQNMDFTAMRDPTETITVRIVRWPGP